ncbi:MAG: lysine--tRNA ligase [Candidatus Altiarchaeum hamiconexum]|uniref:Lysine--tRNA ligase n=1 Tax=Candidatus Altarchaeum hamiconexum TaxID=1803513 RepID=A0A8J8CEK3_9ARCH|nr:lysine--tRNA ligase [Candidatus Altarchaeum hamiconexum]OIQ06330.1 MAG: lysine--tRNA ligase [Candidatus Altarchaeum sp. CG2_30_32_3053]PIN66867.1 MAG: lysine--tRNA ligase [Candidatus Altarchaeum sp. CG12_big_fil_rev_8_21_14_0_65_33_22]PIV27015.1 MAG: lysine--tRNA ligase [Candidatus Altarchaeum sp. CG03_land_8_20_14_0_80_32_618]PIX49128.1 MAG: lysine--tRNA ligase [Candidatus Altarchaeum sp. CG_4_8_14_3_um_filter_33_2054]PIZ32331.1 MAG: lysine--tRNA ligase [Candidatus Altarchaeum sp. CG_4_10_
MFWADQLANQAVARVEKDFAEGKTSEKIAVLRCGQTPSGGKHIGNLNDVIRAYFVYKSIKEKIENREWDGNVRFIHTSDDRDPLKDIPARIMDLDGKWHESNDMGLEKFLGMPLCRVPDPFGCCLSWSEHFTKVWVEGIKALGIEDIEIYYNNDLYKHGKFESYIKTVFENLENVSAIVTKFQATKHENYIPFDAICPNCGRLANIDGFDLHNNTVKFKCCGKEIKKKKTEGCGFEGEVGITEGKLQWRFEWPAQWGIFNTTYEPFGKDHYEGSWKSGQVIAREIYNIEPPIPFVYEFFLVNGEKMSASKGNVYVTQEILEILEPEIFLYFYTKKPDKQRDLNLAEIFRLTDEFDTVEKIYYGVKEGRTEHETEDAKRMYDISINKKFSVPPKRMPYVFTSTLSQIYGEKAIEKVNEINKKENLYSESDLELIKIRLEKAGRWANLYIPKSERTVLIDDEEARKIYIGLDDKIKELLNKFAEMCLENLSGKEITLKIGELIKASGDKELAIKFYKACYMLLFGKEKGPKLAGFIDTLDRDFIIKRFKSR